MSEKSKIRTLMRERRQALTVSERFQASRRICRHIANHQYFREAKHIALYFSMDGEIDIIPLINQYPKKHFYLPVLPPRGKRRLWFAGYTLGAKLVNDRFGIPTPVCKTRKRAQNLDLILAPLVAFDSIGGRIGMGGGFYDKSLEFIRPGSATPRVRVIGAAHHFQKTETITRERWDIPLHGVITDHGFTPAEQTG